MRAVEPIADSQTQIQWPSECLSPIPPTLLVPLCIHRATPPACDAALEVSLSSNAQVCLTGLPMHEYFCCRHGPTGAGGQTHLIVSAPQRSGPALAARGASYKREDKLRQMGVFCFAARAKRR